MIKTVLIDDERPALRELEYYLKDYAMIEVLGSYSNPLEAIESMKTIEPQLIFMDIEMSQLGGIDLASKILDLCPNADIIFVTAYDQYAIEAFEVNALDYLLKPLSKERFNKTIQRVLKKNNIQTNKFDKKLIIKCFGKFQISWKNEEAVKWRSKKTKELFAFLLYYEGKQISKEEIIDKLWPETEIEKATAQIHNSIYYIRKTLGEYGVTRSQIAIGGNYCLNIGSVDLDIVSFNERILRINNDTTIRELEEIEAIYTGEYLEDIDGQWIEFKREIFLKQYNEVVEKLADSYINNGEFLKAEIILIKAFNKNPFEENITKKLMQLYKTINNKAKAKKHFLEYERILSEELGINPDKNIQRIYEDIINNF